MQELIEKRKKYFEEIDALNKEIDDKAQEYFEQRIEELRNETQQYRDNIALDYQGKFDAINAKIEILDEIISEQMPEAKEIQDLMKEENVAEETIAVPEDKIQEIEEVNEVPAEEPIVDCVEIVPTPDVNLDVVEAQLNETPIEEVVDLDAEEPVNEIIIPTDDIVEEGEQVIETPNDVCEQPVEENVVCDACEANPTINTNTVVKESASRPGMPQILNPR